MEEKEITPEEMRKRDLERVEHFRLLDDTFARIVFKGNPQLAQFVLRIILGIDDLVVEEEGYHTQYDAKRLAGSRSVIMDVTGSGQGNKRFDIEVENWDASAPRAEYHVATMCVENLHEGQEFSELPEIYVIFICGFDKIGDGEPLHSFSYRDDKAPKEKDVFEKRDKTAKKRQSGNKSLGGRTHIVYVNGSYEEPAGKESKIG